MKKHDRISEQGCCCKKHCVSQGAVLCTFTLDCQTYTLYIDSALKHTSHRTLKMVNIFYNPRLLKIHLKQKGSWCSLFMFSDKFSC